MMRPFNKEETLRKYLAWLIMLALTYRHGKAMMNLWAWEMTPLPIGLPYWPQLWEGFLMAVRHVRTQDKAVK